MKNVLITDNNHHYKLTKEKAKQNYTMNEILYLANY